FGAEKKLNGSAKPEEIVAELEAEEKPGRKYKPGGINLDDVIKNGHYDLFRNDRSRAVWYVVNALIRASRTDDEIVAVLLDRNNKISEHVYDQKQSAEKYIRKQIGNARASSADGDGGLEDAVALQFSARYADNVRYVHAWGKWLFWDGTRWVFEN